MNKMIDWAVLQKNGMIFIVVTLLSTSVYYGSFVFSESVSDNFIKEERAYNQAQSKYRLAEKNRTLYKQYLTDYRKYLNKGLIGEEKRLSWIEELEAINKNMALPKLSYSIEPRVEVDLRHIRNRNKKIQMNVSEMKIQAGLLHEGDLLTLLQTLEQKAAGFYSLKECSLVSRFSNKIKQYSPRNAYLDVSCELDWLTVKVES